MTLLGLDIADVITLSAYLIGITILGMWMGKTIHNTTDFFVGGRRFGKILSTFFAFGAGTHSDQAVSVAAKTYTSGMSGIWYQWLWLFITPFYWVLAVISRRFRCLTLGDYFEIRYARSVAMLCVLVGVLNLMVNMGTMLKGSGAIISATSDQISEDWAIAVMTLLFVSYGVVGGLAAAVVTDFVQGLLTIVFSFILLPVALHAIGGFSALHQKVAEVFAEHPAPGVESAEGMWSLVAPGEITLFYIIVITINALVGIVAQPHGVPAANASRTEREAQIGVVAGNLIKRFCTVAWCLLGMCAFVLFEGMTDPDEIDQSFGLIARKFLPAIAPGLIGIFIASLLASIMSSCDAFMITCSGLFTHNLYRPLTKNRKSERHYVNVGRLAAIVVVAGGVGFAYSFESVLDGLELFWKVSAMLGIAFWAGLVWRRATTAAAWAATLVGFSVFLFTSDIMVAGHELWSFDKTVANHRIGEVPEDLETALNADTRQMPDPLREHLANHDVHLADEAKFSIEEKDNETDLGVRWLIEDGDRAYTILKDRETGSLDVYANDLPIWMLWKGELSLPWQMIIYLTIGFATMIGVSLFTRRTETGRLDRFYAVIRTPTQPGEVIEQPFTLPAGMEPAPVNKLIDHPDIEIPVPSRRTVVGFLVVVAIVGALVGGVAWLVSVGA